MKKLVDKTVNIHLVGTDGNAFALMGNFKHQARKDGWTKEEIKLVLDEAMTSDYDYLLQTLCSHTLDYAEPDNEGFVEEAAEQPSSFVTKMKGILNSEEERTTQLSQLIVNGLVRNDWVSSKNALGHGGAIYTVKGIIDRWEKDERERVMASFSSTEKALEELDRTLQSDEEFIRALRAFIINCQEKAKKDGFDKMSRVEVVNWILDHMTREDYLYIVEAHHENIISLNLLNTVESVKDELPIGHNWWEEDLTGRPILCKGQSCVVIVDEGKTVLIESPVGRVRGGKFYPYQYRVLKGKLEELSHEAGLLVKTNPDPLSYEVQFTIKSVK